MARRIRITSKSHTITTKQPLISYPRIDKGKSKFDQNKARKQKEFKNPEGTRREGPPFPHNLSTKSQEFIPLILEKNRGRTKREEETAPGGRKRAGLFCMVHRREERGDGYLRCPRRGPKYPRLKLDTKTPVGAKPEIYI